MPADAPFAILPEPAAPWPGPKSGGRFEMRGYRLDALRRPTFLYSFDQIQIEDYIIAVPGELDWVLRRNFVVKSAVPLAGLYFLAWAGASIESKTDGGYLADGKLLLRISGDGNPVLRKTNGRSELLIPILFRGGSTQFTLDLIWY